VRLDYRLFACMRCRRLVAICSVCDRGQWYCGKACSQQSRRENSRAAGRRYQDQRPGRLRHAARQARYRERRAAAAQKVTQHTTPGERSRPTLRATTTEPGSRRWCDPARQAWGAPGVVVCDVCGARCAPYARFEPLRRRRRAGVEILP
jgi:hypothetical protein